MAHEITTIDNLFSVRQIPWHHLGTVLEDYPTREEAQKIAHPWEPITAPVFAQTVAFNEDGPVEKFEEIEGFKSIQRSDNGHLLGVVRDTYEPVTNSQMWDIAEAIQGEGVDVKYETAGSLSGGSKVWLMMRLDEPIEVKGDPRGATIPFYSLQNAHDGSGSFRGQATMTRIVCANTAHIADLDARARGTEFTFHHTKNVHDRIEEARAALAGWRQSLEDWKQITEVLIDTRFGFTNGLIDNAEENRAVEAFLSEFIPLPSADVISDRVRNNIETERDKWRTCYTGITGEGLRGSAYGLVQASVEYAEHYRRAHTAENRFKRTVLNRSQIIQGVSTLAQEIAHEFA